MAIGTITPCLTPVFVFAVLSTLVLPVFTILNRTANLSASKTAGAVAALKEVVLLAAAGLVLLASGEQLVPRIRTSWIPIADFCTVARKTWAGHGALLCAKGAIRPSVRFVRAVHATNTSITKPLCRNTQTAISAPGKAWPVAVVAEGRRLVAAIVAFIQPVALFLFANAPILQTITFTDQVVRISCTLKAC